MASSSLEMLESVDGGWDSPDLPGSGGVALCWRLGPCPSSSTSTRSGWGSLNPLLSYSKVGSDIGALLDAWLMSRGPWALSLVSSRLLASSGVRGGLLLLPPCLGEQLRELVPALHVVRGLAEDGQHLHGLPVAFCGLPVVHG